MRGESGVLHGGTGHSSSLSCIVYSNPVSEMLWYRDTMLLDNDGNHYFENKGTLHTLIIRTVQEEDFANYSCAATNKFGRGRDSIQLKGEVL